MIKKLGAKYIIIGHSENRSNGETNNLINKKIHSTILNNLNVIFCIGENLFEKKNKKTKKNVNYSLYADYHPKESMKGLYEFWKASKIGFSGPRPRGPPKRLPKRSGSRRSPKMQKLYKE